MKLVALQEALAPDPEGDTDAVEHITCTAEVGMLVQLPGPLKFEALEPTLKVQLPWLPPVFANATVALELPEMLLPGLFALNVMVDGATFTMLLSAING